MRLHRGLIASSLIVILAVGVSSAAAADRLFKLTDPSGDDRGDGSFLFPEIPRIEPGELDIVAFSAKQVDGGTEFEAVFTRPVAKPTREMLEGNVLLTDLARLGFYKVNIDVYIDTDRKPGSGRVAMLPGRLAEVDSSTAWERVVCLTPRPDVARSELRRFMLGQAKREIKSERGTVRSEDVDVAKQQIALDVTDDTFFPTRVRVTGRTIAFFVPDEFLGGPARPDWSYVVAVSAADIQASLQTQSLETGMLKLPYTGLFILGIQAGGSRYTLGSTEPDVEMLPPLVDIIVPTGITQRQALRSFDVLAGRPAHLPGVVPAK